MREQGLSQRRAARVKSNGMSKSAASRMWLEKSLEQLELLRNRSLKEQGFIALMIDGVRLANEVWIIVAMGIDRDGNKQMLGFEGGGSENSTAVGGLLDRLKDRGIDSREEQPLLIVRNGR